MNLEIKFPIIYFVNMKHSNSLHSILKYFQIFTDNNLNKEVRKKIII